jgi:TetR/AcrR family transcriptional repressor of nem operon
MPRPSVREQLVDAAADCFHETGINGTGVQEITRAAGVPKGSFYNHFESKEALAVEIMDRYAAGRRLEMLADPALQPIPRLRAHFEFLAEELGGFDYRRGCLFGNFGTELSTQSSVIREQVDARMDLWATAVTAVLDEAGLKHPLDTGTLARFLTNAWEGAALRAKVTRTRGPLDDFFAAFDSLMG